MEQGYGTGNIAVLEAANEFGSVFSSSNAECDAKYFHLFEDSGITQELSSPDLSLSPADAVSPQPASISA